MRWLLWRELAVMTRMPALWVAMCVQLLVLAALITVWGEGVPTMTGSVSDQFTTLHGGLLLLLLPWIAARAVGEGRTVAMVAAVAACTPRQVVASKYLALVLVLLAVSTSALPLKILALRISSVDVWRGTFDLPLIIALCTLSAAIATVSIATGLSRFTAWIVGTVAMMLGSAMVAPTQVPAVILGALVMTGLSAMRADRRFAYLPIGGYR